VFEFVATIPLTSLHDFFKKVPLCKAPLLRLVLNLHAPCSYACTCSAAGAITLPTVQSQTGYIPFQVSPPSANAGSGFVTAAAMTAWTASLRIGNSMATSCVFRASMLELNPEYSMALLKNPIRTIRFQDFQQSFNIKNLLVPGGTLSQQLVTPACARMTRLLIVPLTSPASNGSQGISSLLSPFSSAGTTVSPYAWLSQLQVHLSGQNVFPSSRSYRFGQWTQEQQGINQLNGGSTAGLRSSLIDEASFSTAYGYISVNLEHCSPEQVDIPRSLAISCTNSGSKSIDLMCFVFYRREVSIDSSTGQVVI
jgi:hypothetical protein